MTKSSPPNVLTTLERLEIWNFLKKCLRDYFALHSYLEVETPIIVTTPGAEIYQRYFSCTWLKSDQSKRDFFLRASPELEMKWLMAQGCTRIFQMGKCFRNGGEFSQRHNPEFTMLEWYHNGIDFLSFINFSLDLIQLAHEKICTEFQLPLIKYSPHFFTIPEAFKTFANIDILESKSPLLEQARTLGLPSVNESDDFETAYFKILLDIIEPAFAKLGLVVLYDFLPMHSALAKVEDGYAKRFEIYFKGHELCNGYKELTDYTQNLSRFSELNKKRAALNLETLPLDKAFLAALHTPGLPPCCGNALGLDRLLAAIFTVDDIKCFSITPGPFTND